MLDDGGEVDLDLGNYERFLDITLHKDNNITTGKIYQGRRVGCLTSGQIRGIVCGMLKRVGSTSALMMVVKLVQTLDKRFVCCLQM